VRWDWDGALRDWGGDLWDWGGALRDCGGVLWDWDETLWTGVRECGTQVVARGSGVGPCVAG